MGEPLRFGWEPGSLPDWLGRRGFHLVSDRGDEDLARELFRREWTLQGAGGRIAVARPMTREPRGP